MMTELRSSTRTPSSGPFEVGGMAASFGSTPDADVHGCNAPSVGRGDDRAGWPMVPSGAHSLRRAARPGQRARGLGTGGATRVSVLRSVWAKGSPCPGMTSIPSSS